MSVLFCNYSEFYFYHSSTHKLKKKCHEKEEQKAISYDLTQALALNDNHDNNIRPNLTYTMRESSSYIILYTFRCQKLH